MKRELTIVVFSLLIISACSPPDTAPLSDAERNVMAEAIVGRMHSYVSALESLDPAAVESFYVISPDFRVVSDGQLLTRDSLLAAIGLMSQELQSFEGTWDSITVTPLGRDTALADAWFRRVITDNAGNELRDWGTVTWVWVKDTGEWRLIHGQAVHFGHSESPYGSEDSPND